MRWIFLMTMMTCMAASSQAQIRVDYDQSVDFSKYKTFRFEPGTVIRKLGVRDTTNTFLNQYIREAVTKDLEGKGLTPTTGKADLVITYMLGAREKQQVQNYGPYYPYYGGFGGFGFMGWGGWWGPGWNTPYVRNYEEGTVVIDVYDAKEAQLIWRAYAVSSIDKFNEKKFVNKQIKKSFKKFPPES